MIGEHSGTAVWWDLTEAIKGDLNASFETLDLEMKKLTVLLTVGAFSMLNKLLKNPIFSPP